MQLWKNPVITSSLGITFFNRMIKLFIRLFSVVNSVSDLIDFFVEDEDPRKSGKAAVFNFSFSLSQVSNFDICHLFSVFQFDFISPIHLPF